MRELPTGQTDGEEEGEIARPTCAVLFTAWKWDAFTARQLERLAACVGSADLWVVVDETRNLVGELPSTKVFRVTESLAAARGLAYATTGASLFWYCVDYLSILFFESHPAYNYYVMVEHDVVLQEVDFDGLIARMQDEEVDYIGLPIKKARQDWPWYAGHVALYGDAQLRCDLCCFSAYSSRAMLVLRDRRFGMSPQFAEGDLRFWPIGEAFIPTEAALAGLKRLDLDAFGDTTHYDWWPPTHEDALVPRGTPTFLHPVLTGDSYLRSVLRHHGKMSDLFRRGSTLRSWLSRFPARHWIPFAAREVSTRAVAFAKRKAHALGWGPSWTQRAEGGGREAADRRA